MHILQRGQNGASDLMFSASHRACAAESPRGFTTLWTTTTILHAVNRYVGIND